MPMARYDRIHFRARSRWSAKSAGVAIAPGTKYAEVQPQMLRGYLRAHKWRGTPRPARMIRPSASRRTYFARILSNSRTFLPVGLLPNQREWRTRGGTSA